MTTKVTQLDASAAAARLTADDLVVLQALLSQMDSSMADRARAVVRRATLDWPALEHAVVAQELAPRCLRSAPELGLSLPSDLRQRLENVAGAAAVRARRQRFTTFCWLEAASAAGISSVLLKGAALAGDYDEPQERHMIDIDLLVRPGDVERACAAAATFGHVASPDALPSFFRRLVHFETLLQPSLDGMVPIDLHWRLHHESLLLTVDHEALWRQRREVVVFGRPAARLSCADEWLHVATHMFATRGGVPNATPEQQLAEVLLDRSGSLHGKWVRDLVIATEAMAVTTAPRELAAAAVAWSATHHAAAALAMVQPLLSPFGRAYADAVARSLPTGDARPARIDAPRAHARRDVAHPAVGFRLRELRRLTRWLWPPTAWLRRMGEHRGQSQPAPPVLWWWRFRHASAVLIRVAAALVLLPIALAARPFTASARRRLQSRLRAPASVMAHVQRAAAFERAVVAGTAMPREDRR